MTEDEMLTLPPDTLLFDPVDPAVILFKKMEQEEKSIYGPVVSAIILSTTSRSLRSGRPENFWRVQIKSNASAFYEVSYSPAFWYDCVVVEKTEKVEKKG